MDWDAIGAIGEVLGALGVLVTLVYLSIQIKSNAAQTYNATIESVMSADTTLRSSLIGGPVPKVYAKMQSGEALNAEERLILTYYLQSYMQGWEVAFYLNKRGSLPDDVLYAIAFRRMATLLSTNKVIPWSGFQAGYTPAFQAHVEAKCAEFEVMEKPWELNREQTA